MPPRTTDCVRRSTDDVDSEEIPLVELVRRAQFGNSDAFARLADELRPRVLVVLRKRMQGYDDIEDIAQDTFTKAWRHIKSYDSNRSFVAWIYTIALRRATDYQRSNRRRQKLSQPLPENELPAKPGVTATARDSADNVWRVAREVLSASQYTAMWLRYSEELSVGEIAATTGRTQVATRVLLHRARSVVRKALSERGPSDE